MNVRVLSVAWNRFWFSPKSPLPVALFRILSGILVLWFCALAQPDWSNLFGSHGIISTVTTRQALGPPPADIVWLLPGNESSLYFLFWALVLFAVMLSIGLASRLSAAAAFLILATLDYQDHFVFHGGYAILRLMILYLAFSSCGDAVSFDRLIDVWTARKPKTGPASYRSCWPQRLMQVQLALAYWSAVSWKLNGGMWIDGTAVYYASRLCEIRRLDIPFIWNHLWTVKLITWSTLLVEFSLCTLVWIREFRYTVLLLGLMLHLGLELTFSTSILQWVMVASYVTFIEPSTLSRAMNAIRARLHRLTGEPLVLAYNSGGDLSFRLAETVKRMDILQLVSLKDVSREGISDPPAETLLNQISVCRKGQWLNGADALQAICPKLPLLVLLYPLVRLPASGWLISRSFALLTRTYRQGSDPL